MTSPTKEKLKFAAALASVLTMVWLTGSEPGGWLMNTWFALGGKTWLPY